MVLKWSGATTIRPPLRVSRSSSGSTRVDGEIEPVLVQDAREVRRRSFALGGHGHPVAVGQQRAELAGDGFGVAGRRRPAAGRDRGGVRRVRRGHQRPRPASHALQEPFGRQVEAAEAFVLVGAPRAGQGGGQVGLLREHVRRPVPQPPRLDQDDLGVVGQAIGQQPVTVDQPGQPALHPVEREATRQPLPLLPAPRLLPDQLLGPAADVVRDPQLAGREDEGLLDVVGRALVVHRELAEAIDLVAPQVDAHGRVRRGREDVDDRPAAGHLASMLDQFLAPVPGRTSRARRSSASRTSPGRTTTGSTSSSPGPSRWRSALMAPTTMRGGRPPRSLWSSPASRHSTRSRRPIVSTLGLTRSKGSVSQAGKSSTSSGGRYRCRSSTSRCAAVPVGTATRSGARLGQPGEPGQRQRPGGFRDGQDRAAAAEHGRQGGLVAQEWGERLETHRRAEHRTAPGPPFLRGLAPAGCRGARLLVTRTTPATTSSGAQDEQQRASEPVSGSARLLSAELAGGGRCGAAGGSVVTASELGVVEPPVLVVGRWSVGRSSPRRRRARAVVGRRDVRPGDAAAGVTVAGEDGLDVDLPAVGLDRQHRARRAGRDRAGHLVRVRVRRDAAVGPHPDGGVGGAGRVERVRDGHGAGGVHVEHDGEGRAVDRPGVGARERADLDVVVAAAVGQLRRPSRWSRRRGRPWWRRSRAARRPRVRIRTHASVEGSWSSCDAQSSLVSPPRDSMRGDRRRPASPTVPQVTRLLTDRSARSCPARRNSASRIRSNTSSTSGGAVDLHEEPGLAEAGEQRPGLLGVDGQPVVDHLRPVVAASPRQQAPPGLVGRAGDVDGGVEARPVPRPGTPSACSAVRGKPSRRYPLLDHLGRLAARARPRRA